MLNEPEASGEPYQQVCAASADRQWKRLHPRQRGDEAIEQWIAALQLEHEPASRGNQQCRHVEVAIAKPLGARARLV
jgi:hypothetical protein